MSRTPKERWSRAKGVVGERVVFREPHFSVFSREEVNPRHAFAALTVDAEVLRLVGAVFPSPKAGCALFVAGVIGRSSKEAPTFAEECAGYVVLTLDRVTMKRRGSGALVVGLTHFDDAEPLRKTSRCAATLPAGAYVLTRYERSRGWYERPLPPDLVLNFDGVYVNYGKTEDLRRPAKGEDTVHTGLTVQAKLTAGGISPFACVPEYE